jgi:hypothetical protein
MRAGGVAMLLLGLLGCGREPLAWTIDPPGDAAATAEVALPRVPQHHRPAGSSCPAGRAAGSLPGCSTGGAPTDLPGSCLHDGNCTAGTNGRCVSPRVGGPLFCPGLCSYDQCSDDSGCHLGPCECRTNEASAAPNVCEESSNCRVDSDCGAGGFCSPSLVGAACQCPGSPDLCDSSTHCFAGTTEVPCSCGDSCGHGYYCHTPDDACLDDADCVGQGLCSYDRLKHRWSCLPCDRVP